MSEPLKIPATKVEPHAKTKATVTCQASTV